VNVIEREMVDLLVRLRETAGVVAVKAEFEAEGTRTDELLRLKEIATVAGVGLALKIGGCEAIRDLFEARQFGSSFVIAPMIESVYALQKFDGAIRTVFSDGDYEESKFLFNIETFTGLTNLPEMLELLLRHEGAISGVVFGRVDFTGSLGMDRDAVNSTEVMNRVLGASSLVSEAGLEFVVGGGVSGDSIDALRQVRTTQLNRFETRKVVFDGGSIDMPEIASGLLDAVRFELLWLKNKRHYYAQIVEEDERRIDMLQKRWDIRGV
jgi:hypothetical protein